VPWLALTLAVAAAQAETLSDALLEHGAQSVWIEPAGRLHALLPEGGDAAATLGLAAAAAGLATPPYRTFLLADADWVRATQAQFGPQFIAGKLCIVPSWHEAPSDAGVVLRLDPGLAFGTLVQRGREARKGTPGAAVVAASKRSPGPFARFEARA
jgi:ribosomal protein L11 methyltransferase